MSRSSDLDCRSGPVYFATQVMDWNPLQMMVLQRALLPIVRVGVCSPDAS